MWDYSVYKSPIYLLREGQIPIPSVDTWTAKERELHLFAPPSALDAALPAKPMWLLGRAPGGGVMGEPPAGSGRVCREPIVIQWSARPRQEA